MTPTELSVLRVLSTTEPMTKAQVEDRLNRNDEPSALLNLLRIDGLVAVKRITGPRGQRLGSGYVITKAGEQALGDAEKRCKTCDGGSVFPSYGVAPHECFFKKGPEFAIGESTLLPFSTWADTCFVPDLDERGWAGFAYPNACGTFYCPDCQKNEYQSHMARVVEQHGPVPSSPSPLEAASFEYDPEIAGKEQADPRYVTPSPQPPIGSTAFADRDGRQSAGIPDEDVCHTPAFHRAVEKPSLLARFKRWFGSAAA